jgi:hypothetical protein
MRTGSTFASSGIQLFGQQVVQFFVRDPLSQGMYGGENFSECHARIGRQEIALDQLANVRFPIHTSPAGAFVEAMEQFFRYLGELD